MRMNTDGLIIKEHRMTGDDRLVTVLTRDYGVLRAFVRGAQRIKSRSQSGSQLFAYSDLSIYRGRDAYVIDEIQAGAKGYATFEEWYEPDNASGMTYEEKMVVFEKVLNEEMDDTSIWHPIYSELPFEFVYKDRVIFNETPKPILELTIKSVEEKMVSYISKNEIVKDYIHYQNSQYYFAEIGKNEVGYVNVHFLKGSGQIVAKIVEEGKTEQNPDWKGKYVLPTKDNADLKMDTFTKKLKFSAEKYNCENKCYLIINVYSDIKADKIPTRRVFPYTLFVHSYPNNYNNTSIPVISAPLNDYIIGSLEKGKEKDAYDFYQFNLNLNNETIVIDIHSVIGNVLVNIGNKRPIINEADFKFSLKNDVLDHDNVFVISKEEIIAKSPSTDLKDLTLTISLHSSKFNDTITKISYSFSVRLLDEPGKGIYLINSEHQSLRNTELSSKDGDVYKCYYLLKYDYLSDISPLMLYAIDPKETNRPLTIAAKYVDYEDYLFGNLDLTTFDFANKGEEKYLFIKNGFIQNDKPKSILVLVEKNKEAIIQFYASFYTHYDSIYIDPGSPRMKYVPKNETLSLFSSNLSPKNVFSSPGE